MLTSLIIGFVTLVSLVAVGGIIFFMRVRPGGGAAPAAGGASASGTLRSLYNSYKPWIFGGVILLIAAIGFATFSSSSLSKHDLGTLAATAVILAVAVVGAVRSKGNAAIWVTVFVVLALIAWLGLQFYYGAEAPKVVDSWQKENYKSAMEPKQNQPQAKMQKTPAPTVKQETAKWEKTAEDSAHPVRVWSETYRLGVGCAVAVEDGEGTIFQIRYRYDSEKWEMHVPGTSPNMKELQFMLLKHVDQLPYRVTCS